MPKGHKIEILKPSGMAPEVLLVLFASEKHVSVKGDKLLSK